MHLERLAAKDVRSGMSKASGTALGLSLIGIVFQKQHAVDVKNFGNLLTPRQGHGRRGEIVDRRYQVDRLGVMLPTGRIERFPLA